MFNDQLVSHVVIPQINRLYAVYAAPPSVHDALHMHYFHVQYLNNNHM